MNSSDDATWSVSIHGEVMASEVTCEVQERDKEIKLTTTDNK
jgi:hypothetical protein